MPDLAYLLPDGEPTTIKRLLPHIINPHNLTDAELAALGIARCTVGYPTVEWWQQRGERTIDMTVTPHVISWTVGDRPLEDVKVQAKARIDEGREERISAGMQYNFPGEIMGTVQLREQDVRNLQTVATTALSLLAMGMDSPIVFRDAENRQHSLTPQQAAIMTMTASAFGSGVYGQSWALKDQIDTAQTVAEVVAVGWV